MAYKIDIDMKLLTHLHLNKRHSLQVLADKVFFVSRQTLYNRLKEANIKVGKEFIDPQEVKRLYLDEQLSLYSIATKFNCSHTRVNNILRSQNVKLRSKHDWMKNKKLLTYEQ